MIAEHTDINDEKQTVAVKEAPKPETPQKTDKQNQNIDTGDTPVMLFGIGILAMLLVLLSVMVLYMRKRRMLR